MEVNSNSEEDQLTISFGMFISFLLLLMTGAGGKRGVGVVGFQRKQYMSR